MFFQKRGTEAKSSPGAIKIIWDEKTVAHFANSDRFDVFITSVVRLRGFGGTDRGPIREPITYEISGFMRTPKFMLVNIHLEQSSVEQFGVWSYNVYDRGGRTPAGDVPFIEVWLTDPHGQIGEALLQSHHAALVSGAKKSNVRFWKRMGDGELTARDKEHDYSYESRFPILGMYAWEEYENSQLPNWAVPYSHERFSTDGTDDWFKLQL
jgi:hypothetical protein